MPIFIFSLYVNGNYKLPQQPEFLSDWDKKHYYLFPLPIGAICEIRQESASEEMSFENVDDDGRMADKLTYKPSANALNRILYWGIPIKQNPRKENI